MKRLHAMPECLRQVVRLGVLGACLAMPIGAGFVAGTPLWAQSGTDTSVPRTFVNVPYVKLPVEIEEAQRAQLRGLVLFMKDTAQGSWTKVDQGPAQQTEFIFRAPHEGEYWFRVVAIDNQGRPQPSDLNKDLHDAVVVVVDTTPPTIDIAYVAATNEGTTVRCDARDANLDPLKTRFFFQTQDQVWRPLDAVAGRPGTFCIPRQAVLTNMIKATAADLAGNPTTRIANLGELAAAAGGQRRSSRPFRAVRRRRSSIICRRSRRCRLARWRRRRRPTRPREPVRSRSSSMTAATTTPARPAGPLRAAADAAGLVAVDRPGALRCRTRCLRWCRRVRRRRSSRASAAAGRAGAAVAPPTITTPMITTSPTQPTGGVTIVTSMPNEEIRPAMSTSQTATATGQPESTMLRPTTTDPSATTTSGNLARQTPAGPMEIVGHPTVFLNYAVEDVGASGVGKIEIWVTGDQGRTWRKNVDVSASKNPAEIRLPGEGVYGLKLVAANGRGFGAQPPQSGDPADSWVEVDMTKPKAEIVAVQCGAGAEAGVLTVFWKAEDKNLATDGIELLHAASREGPWMPIAKGLHNEKGNEGQYRWTPPATAGAQTFLRLIVRDRAGNTAISQTVQPVPLDDLSRPRIRVLNVSTVPHPTQAAPPTINVPAPLQPGIVAPIQATSMPSMPSMPQLTGGNEGR